MSRTLKPTSAEADATKTKPLAQASAPATPNPADGTPQVTPDSTGAVSQPASAAAEAAKAPVDPKTEAATPATDAAVVTIKGPAQGRWRAGRYFGPEAVEIPIKDLSVAEIDLLKADPVLLCTWPA